MIAAFLFHSHTLDHVLSSFGYLAVFAFVGIESLGVPFPGETMLITASLYAAATGHLDIAAVIAFAAAGAIIGDNAGYGVGRWGGLRLLRRYGKYVRIDERRLRLGRYVFMRHGGKVVFFGRFVSVLRTYAAFLAGANQMRWQRFLLYNALGGVVWALIYGLGYYYLGSLMKSVSTPVDVAIGAVAALAVVASIVFIRRNERRLQERADRELPADVEDLDRPRGPGPASRESMDRG